jgi:hypothetical protein
VCQPEMDNNQDDQMDVEPSAAARRASTPVPEDDLPELLGEVGASPPLWGFCFADAGTGQRSSESPSESGPLTRARSRRTGVMPSPMTELRLCRPTASHDDHSRDSSTAGISPALQGPTTGLRACRARDIGSDASSLETQHCRGVLAPLPLPMDEPPLGHNLRAVTTVQHHPAWGHNPFDLFGGNTAPFQQGNRPCRGTQVRLNPTSRPSHRHSATRGSVAPLATQDMFPNPQSPRLP